MSKNYDDIVNEAKEAESEAMIYIFQTLKSLDERIKAIEDKNQ